MIKKEKSYYNKFRYLPIRKHLLFVLLSILIYSPICYAIVGVTKKMNLLEAVIDGGLNEYVEAVRKAWGEDLLVAAKTHSPVIVEFVYLSKRCNYSIIVNSVHMDTRYTLEFAKRRHKEIRNILTRKGFRVA